MEIEKRIEWVKNQLVWRLEEVISKGDLVIESDPWKRTHTIYFPNQHRQVEYLHQLAHAVLAERHHLLSTHYFEKGTPEEKLTELCWALRVASDWYADYLLWHWVPEELGKEIREHVPYVFSLPKDKFAFYTGGLVLAQGVFYLKVPKNSTPQYFWPVIDALLQTPADRPSITSQTRLINDLASLTTPLRVDLTSDGGVDLWRVIKKAGTPRYASRSR